MTRSIPLLTGLATLVACSGPQSTLDPAGVSAEQIAKLFGWMAAGAVVVWWIVVGLAIYAVRVPPERHGDHTARFVVGAGAVAPTILLAGLLIYGLSMMPALEAPPADGDLTIEIAGEQWWWRVRYLSSDGQAVELANELRLPVGERVELRLSSPDVVHSFWIPSLAGKRDMIPGRTTRLVLEPTRTGTFRGACAEYCGASHARMALYAVVMERPAFDAWLAAQREPGASPADSLAARGGEAFFESGCGACHSVRGTPADGIVGPDLTHVGSRVSIGAATLDNDASGFRRWLAATKEIKPGVHMPPFDMLPEPELAALAAYLESLQ